jgi:hypothetical protein
MPTPTVATAVNSFNVRAACGVRAMMKLVLAKRGKLSKVLTLLLWWWWR